MAITVNSTPAAVNTRDSGSTSYFHAVNNPANFVFQRKDHVIASAASNGGKLQVIFTSTTDYSANFTAGDYVYFSSDEYNDQVYIVDSAGTFATNTKVTFTASYVGATITNGFLNENTNRENYRLEVAVTQDNADTVTRDAWPDNTGLMYFDVSPTVKAWVGHSVASPVGAGSTYGASAQYSIAYTEKWTGSGEITTTPGTDYYGVNAARQPGDPYGENMGDFVGYDVAALDFTITSVVSGSPTTNCRCVISGDTAAKDIRPGDWIWINWAGVYVDSVFKVVHSDYDGTNSTIEINHPYSATATGTISNPKYQGKFLTDMDPYPVPIYRVKYTISDGVNDGSGNLRLRIDGDITNDIDPNEAFQICIVAGNVYTAGVATSVTINYNTAREETNIDTNLTYTSDETGGTVYISYIKKYVGLSYIHNVSAAGGASTKYAAKTASNTTGLGSGGTLQSGVSAGQVGAFLTDGLLLDMFGDAKHIHWLAATVSGRAVCRPLEVRPFYYNEDPLYNNNVTLCWLNNYGGWDYWTFSGNQITEGSTGETGEFVPNYTTLAGLKTMVSPVKKTDQKRAELSSIGLNRAQNKAVNALQHSAAVYMLNDDFSFSEVRPLPGSYISENTGVDAYTVSIAVRLQPTNTITN